MEISYEILKTKFINLSKFEPLPSTTQEIIKEFYSEYLTLHNWVSL